jgi:energy-converting hydrogenase Eha subunit F
MNRVPKWFVLVLALVFLLGLAAPVLADEAKGKIKSVDNDKSQFVGKALVETNRKICRRQDRVPRR